MAQFSEGIINDFRDFRRKKRDAALNRVGQAVGGTAETMRTGRSAAATFADRAPQYDVMSKKEKLAQTAPLVQALGQEEMFYSGEARKEREAVMNNIMAGYKAQLQAQSAAYTAMTAAAQTRARIASQYGEQRINDKRGDRNDIRFGDPQTQAIAGGAGKAAREELRQNRAGALAYFTEQAATGGVPNWDELPASEKKKAVTGAMERSPEFKAEQKAITDRYAKSIFAQERPPGQAAAGLELYAKEVGVDINDVLGGDPALLKLMQDRDAALVEVNTDLLELVDTTHREGRQTFASDAGVQAAADNVQTAVEAYRATADGGAPAAPGEAGAPGAEGAPGGAAPQGFMGIQGTQPATDSRSRTMQLLSLIEEYPEHPPLQEARSKLLDSQEFKDYQAKRGYADPNIAFRIMKREMKQQVGKDKRDTLEQVREDRKQGRFGRASEVPRPRKPTAPVQGASSRQAEVESGGTD